MLIVGIVIGAYKDYFMTSKIITQDVRAHIQSFEGHEDQFNMAVILVNAGNRQSIIRMVQPTFPFKLSRGTGHLYQNPSMFTVNGVPAALNPGETRLITIRGTLPIQQMYEHGSPDGDSKENIHKAALSLCFRSQDFHGQRHDGIWQVGEILVNSARIAGWGNFSNVFPLFDQRAWSGDCGLLPLTQWPQ